MSQKKEPIIESLEICDNDIANIREQFYIGQYSKTNILFNIYSIDPNWLKSKIENLTAINKKLYSLLNKNIAIENSNTVPVFRGSHGESRFPFSGMEVNDSFLLKDYTRTQQTSVHTCSKGWCKANKKDWRFRTKKEGSDLRVWRTK